MGNDSIRIICGPGNGKSAAAIGYGLIGALNKKKVIIVQFLKGVLEENSLELLEHMDLEMKVFRFERSQCSFEDLPEDQKKEEIFNLKNGFNYAKKVMATGECDILILDEVLGLVDQAVVSEEEFVHFLESADEDTKLIMTGRVCPEKIRRIAGHVSYVENIKVDNSNE